MKSVVYARTGTILSSLAWLSIAGAAEPLSMEGWRYVEGPNDLHVYACDRSDCLPGSRVFWHFDSLNSAPFSRIWRKYEAAVSELLNEPSKTFSQIRSDPSLRRLFQTAMSPDGLRTYYEFADVEGPGWRASLSSASLYAKASSANLEQFEAALKQIRN
jgi:hypothetical protein